MIEVRTYDGDAAELARFTREVWRQSYEGRMLVPLWDADYLDWQVLDRPGSPDFLLGMYDGTRLIGTDLGSVFRFRLRGRELEATLRSWFAVLPDYRRHGAGAMLVAEQRRRHRERGLPMTFGYLYAAWSGSHGPRFFARQPGHVIVRETGFWSRLLNHRAVARNELSRLKRYGARALGAVQGPPSAASRRTEGIRPYRDGDLADCLDLANALVPGTDLGCVWTADHLAHHLRYRGVPRTVVLERDGRVGGFVNYHRLDATGRGRIRSAVIDILALGTLSLPDSEALLHAALGRMADEGVDVALVLGQSGRWRRTLLGCGFLPLPSDLQLAVAPFREDVTVDRLASIEMPFR